jgi:hypothetical protein
VQLTGLRAKQLSSLRHFTRKGVFYENDGAIEEELMQLKHAVLAGALAVATLAVAAPASAVVVGVSVGVPAPGHYCGWRHRCWAYRWHGGYYNYYWRGRYWHDRWRCRRGWCYR